MAKRSKRKIVDTAKAVNTTENYQSWTDLHGIVDTKENKTAFEIMAKVRENYEKSRSFLMSSCFWDAFQENTSATAFAGGSWYDRRTLQEKMALMWYRKPQVDDFMSNIKSPMARGRINTFVNWMKKINLEFGARPNNEDDRNAAFVAEKTINYWMQNSNAKAVLGDVWEDLATHGNAFVKLSYVQQYRDFQFPVTKSDEEDDNKEEGEDYTEETKVYGEVERTLVQDDIVIEHVPISEIFPDPMARNLHGDTYRAGWVIRKRYVTLDFLHSMYDDNPRAKYLDKVKGSSAYRDMTVYFFQPPRDIMSSDIVELLEMEDQDKDRLYVIANDIPILGFDDAEPLPQNFKEVSYFKFDFIRIPGQFYSMGICDLLDNIQASYEVALNMIADYIYRTYNYKLLVEADNYGEIKQSLQRTDQQFIPIDVSDGKPLSSKIMPLIVTPIGMDIFTFLEVLERQATLATNIDPAQMAQLVASKTATSDMLNRELLMTMIGGVIENNTQGDFKVMGRALWKLQQQCYTKSRVKKIVGEEEDVIYNKVLRFQGLEIKLNDDTKLLEEKEIDDDSYSFFEVTDEYTSTKDELDVFVRPESKEVQSQALDEQNMKQEFAQLMPFAVDPNNAQQLAVHPMPMVNAVELFKEYFDTSRLPQKLLINKSGKNSIELKKAESDVMKILNNIDEPSADNRVQSIPGQSSTYLEYCYSVLDALVFQRDQLMKQVKDDMDKQFSKIKGSMNSAVPVNTPQ